jgi:two-component sensor histidine kinase
MESASSAKGAIRATGLAMLSMLALLSAILVFENYSAERSKAAISAHRAAHVVATQFGWVFESSAHVLGRIDDNVSRLGFGRPGEDLAQAMPTTFAGLGTAVRDLPSGLQFSLYDQRGRLSLSSMSSPKRRDISHLSIFRRLQKGQELAIQPMIDAPDDPDAVFLMARRLGEGDDFRGVAVVHVPLTTLQSLADTLGFVDGSTISLVATDGIVIARSPPIRPMDLSKTALFDALAKSPDGFYETISPADGVARIVGYWTLPDWPVVAIAARARSSALEGFWRNLGLAAVLSLPILFGVGWLIHDLLQLMQIDERRRKALAVAHDRANFLLREIHHRVKNNLATVSGLIRLERLPDEVKDRLQGRIAAMVAVHEAMYLSDQFQDICIRPYLDRLLGDVARGWGMPVDLHLSIPRLELPGERAMLLGLLANELVSNAFKHAFVPRGRGRLEVRIEPLPDTATQEGWLRLVVADDGPGFSADDAPARMGSKLVAAFAAQLGGHVTVESQGRTVVTVEFPRIYTAAELADGDADQPRPAQSGSITASRSMKDILLSIQARSRSRT